MNKTDKSKMHQGHRKRLRNTIGKLGFENINDINKIEYLLSLAIPRKDTNELAHLLLEHFGSFAQVLEADSQDLMQIPGIGQNAAEIIPIFKHIAIAYYMDVSKKYNVIKNYQDLIDYTYPLFLGSKVEQVYALFIRNSNIIIKHEKIAEGTYKNVKFNYTELARKMLLSKCNQVIIAHNHPNGTAHPSVDDTITTESLGRTLALYGLQMIDNVIVSENSFYSFKNQSFYEPKEN